LQGFRTREKTVVMQNSQLPPSETRYDDLIGVVSVNLPEGEDLNHVASKIAIYDPTRFEAVALRVFIQNLPVVTLYAIDKQMQQRMDNKGKLLVHKFKMEMSFEELFSKFKNLNFTLVTGEHHIENMEVINL
jgi:hypothetical protein